MRFMQMNSNYKAPLAKIIEFDAVDIIATSLEEPKEVLVTWGSSVGEIDSQVVSVFE